MLGALGRRSIRLAGGAIPALSTLLLGMVGLLPIDVGGLTRITPLLAAIAVHYWSVFRPDLLPPWAAFAIGLMLDLASGGLVGLYAFVFVLLAGYASSQRRVLSGDSFVTGWAGFAVVMVAVSLLEWTMASLVRGAPMPAGASAVQSLLTVALYPPLFLLLGRAQLSLLRES
ncbi:MAG: rod shape-determining protein MreD [Alphaproteobacteria bacterium]|nr:rod shape-determining protein MreD [Alphaproteobacteria bacterium]